LLPPIYVNAEESYYKEVECGTRKYDVEIIDTAGQDEFADFRNTALAQGDGFLCLFAVNSPYSWQELKELRERIVLEHEDKEELPMVIVGNKKDLDSHRQVPFDEVALYCRSIRCPFIETSAKTGLNIREAFQLLIEQVKLVNPEILEEQWNYKMTHGVLRNGHIPSKPNKECCIL
jgi:GTPase KRas protein